MNYEFEYFNAIKTEKKDIKETLEHLKLNLLKIRKIPNIIDSSKEYKTFEIEKKDSGVFILVDKEITESVKIGIKFKDNHFKIKDIINREIPDLKQIPNSFQIIGTILHINLNEEQLKYKKKIGQIFLKNVRNVKTVITKKGNIETSYRNCPIDFLAGKKDFKTVHIEGKCKFFIDYEKVYWNSKLQNERKKILENFKEGDIVVDGFCGVGPIAIPALKKGCKVYCNDLNPDAIDCLKKNIELNKLKDNNVEIYNEDAKNFFKKVLKANYVFLNLPELSLSFLKYLKHLNEDCKVICFFFCPKKISVEEYLKEKNIQINKPEIEVARNVSPNKEMLVMNFRIADLSILD